jgi:arsenate reductase
VNPNAKRVLIEKGCWRSDYHSKSVDEVMGMDFDLVITVCDSARESCPIFPKRTEVIHIGFEDPDGKPYEEFQKLWTEMENRLIRYLERIADAR